MMTSIANKPWFCRAVGRLFARTFLDHNEYSIRVNPIFMFGECVCTACKVCRWHVSIMKPELPEARIHEQ